MQATAFFALFAGVFGAYYLYKTKRPKWTLVGYLDEIFVFPIKGAKGIPVNSAYMGPLGLKCGKFRDREFMLVDQK